MSLDTVDYPKWEEKLRRDLENRTRQSLRYEPVLLRGGCIRRFIIHFGWGKIRSDPYLLRLEDINQARRLLKLPYKSTPLRCSREAIHTYNTRLGSPRNQWKSSNSTQRGGREKEVKGAGWSMERPGVVTGAGELQVTGIKSKAAVDLGFWRLGRGDT